MNFITKMSIWWAGKGPALQTAFMGIGAASVVFAMTGMYVMALAGISAMILFMIGDGAFK